MNLGRLLELVVAMVAVAIAVSVVTADLLAAACLLQFAMLIVLEHDSETFRTLIDGYERELTFLKWALLLVAFVSLW
ncbi:hypothetical protein [Natronorubrum texcoconense]|uniref:Uncharacterized protein n=1 Tax=Natronorubrum texcoconense TaxID=1095776 RepID=A0A1G9ECV4_9EURY|nr:hypothetical protein [Natronorubrum texcoconense]SDK74000.1 hypothetical protein SAMN04515672_3864 [Natronorubrum texcoconense]